ncbi:MAG: CYTH domain-containing protein [Elusimicrobia bacterium]|nr:CYTH domain-containing protein [Elusimicrobiota bacterium]
MDEAARALCRRLGVEDPRHIEIESKRRVRAEQAEDLREHLFGLKGVRHVRESSFFDQYLDTPELTLLRAGASLRLRYKGDGTYVYLQYKGPGFHEKGALFRSEFSSDRLASAVREESHHDIVHFADISVMDILRRHSDPAMAGAMRRHLGERTIARVNRGVILCLYRKDKFRFKIGDGVLEPSLDKLCAFHIRPAGLHPLSTFWEFENEVKSEAIAFKLERLDELRKFDSRLARRFDLPSEKLDKYHRCAAHFEPLRRPLKARRSKPGAASA